MSTAGPTPPLAPNIAKRLTLVRILLLRARQELSSGLEFGAWQAATALHDAADMCLLTIADHLGVHRQQGTHLRDYPKLIETATGGTKAVTDRLLFTQDLNDARNPAKHRGGFPSVSDITVLFQRTEAALESNCNAYLGRPISSISLADVIDEPDVRDCVKRAESHIAATEYIEANAALKEAWHLLMDRVPGRFDVDVHGLGHPLPQRFQTNEPEEQRALRQWWDRIQPKLQLQLLGVDLVKYSTFESIGPHVTIFNAGNSKYYRKLGDEIVHSAASADFCLNFVLENAIRWQAASRLPKPHDGHTIEIVTACEHFDVRQTPRVSAGRLPVGHRIEGARVGGGPDGSAWFWDDIENGRTFMITDLASAIVRHSMSESEYRRLQGHQYDEKRRREREEKKRSGV
jgi:hypothetical protein